MLANLVIAKEAAAKAAIVAAEIKAREARKGELLLEGKASPKQLEERGKEEAGRGTDEAGAPARWEGARGREER